MFFGATAFSSAPFASEFSQDVRILVDGKQINVAIGDVTVNLRQIVHVNGSAFRLASSTADVITWNLIPPNANQIWIPIDPDNP